MIWLTNRLHDFLAFLLITFVWHFVFGLGSRALCSSTTILYFFIVTPWFFRSIAVLILTFTHMPQSYLAFEAINMSSQKPCILCTHFTQAYKRLDTLSTTIINPCYLHRWHPTIMAESAVITTQHLEMITHILEFLRFMINTEEMWWLPHRR